MKTIAVIAFDGMVAFDFTLACEIFDWTTLNDGAPAYKILICSERRTVQSKLFAIRSTHGLSDALKADTIIVPGVRDTSAPVSQQLIRMLRSAHRKGIRIASVCSGAFVLAEAGLLNGLTATTHWKATLELQVRFPEIQVNPNVLYLDNGQVLTSAGAASGIDLCLYMIRQDYGATVAARSARAAVMPLERAGGQSQFIEHEIPSVEGSLNTLLEWIEKNFRRPLNVSDLAKSAHMSERSLTRKFQEQIGMSPMQFVISVRIRKSQELLETKTLSIDQIAERVGFGSNLGFREHFKKRVGVSPSAYRQTFSPKRILPKLKQKENAHAVSQ